MEDLIREDLINLSNDELRMFYTCKHYKDLPDGKAKSYIAAGEINNTIIARIRQTQKIVNELIISRFIVGKIK